ncbi:MAG TPA: type II secretion system protein [Edaphobacter sp.]|nr:type II secretion system protein [Edaphobacter sp.]
MRRRSGPFVFAVHSAAVNETRRPDEQGFMLVGLIVAIFLILLVLGVAAPKVARDLRREREVEAVHRGNQYVRAIQLYYKKSGTYPLSMEQLEKTNNIRYLRQRYADPMTGKADWRLIKMGEAKTTVKGFFGQPLAGLATGGLGSASTMASPGIGGSSSGGSSSGGAAPFGSSPGIGGSSPGGSSSGGAAPFGSPAGYGGGLSGATGSTGTAGSPGGTPGTSGIGGSSGGIGSQSATTFSGSGGPFVGVGSSKSGESIIDLNEQTSYQTWEFIYDPRIEQMKGKASLFGGGPGSVSSTNLGSAQQSLSPGMGGSTSPTSPTSPSSPTTPTTTPTTPSYPSTTPQ